MKSIHLETKMLVASERKITHRVLLNLLLVEKDQSHFEVGSPTLFHYCTRYLGYCESSARLRIKAMRLMREVPEAGVSIKNGDLNLSNAAQVQSFLDLQKVQNQETKEDLVKKVLKKSQSEATRLLLEEAGPNPQFKRKSYLRQVTPKDWDLHVTLSESTKEKLERIRDLRSHVGMSLESVLDYLAELGLQELTKPSKPQAVSVGRCATSAMRRHVLENANYKCQYPGCECTAFLQIDHIIPYSCGGKTEIGNLQVLCAFHNRFKGGR